MELGIKLLKEYVKVVLTMFCILCTISVIKTLMNDVYILVEFAKLSILCGVLVTILRILLTKE